MPDLPATFRPLWARRVLYPLAAVALVSFLAVAVLLPEGWPLLDRASFVVVGVLGTWFLHRLADVRVEARPTGVTVVNLFRRRELEWPEILNVRLGRGDPWLTLDLADGDSLPAMGVQGSDGEYARRQARRLGQLVAEQTRTDRND